VTTSITNGEAVVGEAVVEELLPYKE